MGNLIDKLKKEKPAFLVEFNEFVQKIKLENIITHYNDNYSSK